MRAGALPARPPAAAGDAAGHGTHEARTTQWTSWSAVAALRAGGHDAHAGAPEDGVVVTAIPRTVVAPK